MRPRRQKENIPINDIANRIRAELDDAAVREELARFGAHVLAPQVEAIRRYISILLFWNQTVNLTSVSNAVEVLVRHFGESMFAVGAVPISLGRLADVGSGAGFPGLPIKLLRPDLEVVLIEANIRKTSFLVEIVSALDLRGVQVRRGRAEDLELGANPYDFVTARAVGHFEQLLDWSRRVLRPSGSLVLWLGRKDAHRVSRSQGWRWRDPIVMPASSRRVVLVGEKAMG
jgi:16S rRNA (guanine527-N7)-methyltransferase